MRRLSLFTLLLLLLLTAVPLAGLWMLGHSPAALQALVARLPQQTGPIEYLSIEGVEGSLAGGFRLQRIEIRHDLFHLQISNARGRLKLWPLLWQTLHATELSVEEFALQPQPRDIPPPSRPPFFLPGLVTATIDGVSIERIVITQRSGLEVRLDQTFARGNVRQRNARITELQSSLLGVALSGEAKLKANRPLILDGSVRASLDAADAPDWLAEASVAGDLAELVIDARLLEPFQADIEAGSLRALPPWNLAGTLWVRDLDASRFGAPSSFDDVEGPLQVQLDQDSWQARGALRTPNFAIQALNLEFEGLPRGGRIETRRLVLAAIGQPSQVAVVGSFGLGSNQPRVALAGTWQGLGWPLTDPNPAVRSEQGRFSVVDQARGSDKVYILSSDAQLQVQALPALRVQAAAELSEEALRLMDARVDALGGQWQLQGSMRRGERTPWSVQGSFKDINPGTLWEGLPGKLAGVFRLQATGFEPRDALELRLDELGGQLRGAAARGGGMARFNRSGTIAEFRALEVAAGGLALALDGVWDTRNRNLDFAVNADDLAVFGAGSRGKLRAEGQVRGSPESMQLAMTADAKDIDFAGLRVDKLKAEIDVNPVAGGTAPARADIRIEGIGFGKTKISRIDYQMRGEAIRHDIKLDVIEASGLGLRGRGSGVFLGDQWRQDWQQLDLDLPAQISLALRDLLSLRLTTNSLRVEPFCLRGRNNDLSTEEASLCSAGEWRADRWRATATVQGLPLDTVLPRPSPRIRYDGLFNATVELDHPRGSALLGNLNAEFERAALRRQRLTGQEEVLPLGSGSLTLKSAQTGLDGELAIRAGNRGRALGILRAERNSAEQAWSELPLRATLQADSSALALLYLYVPEIDRSSGDLLADLIVGGTLGTPSVNGVLRLSNGELDFYQINLALRDITAEARLIDNGFELESSARSGTGRIEADAKLEWRDQKPFGDLRIRGENLLLVDIPEARISASPDLRFQVEGRRLMASGTVRVPEARLTPADLTGAVIASADEKLVGPEVRDDTGTFEVSSNLRLILGDRVSLDSFGLTGRLQGDLTVQSTPEAPTRALGELRVSDGRYTALGRQLDIERGRLLFTGGFITDPAMDVRAVKVFPDVKAGVNVRGSLREPRLTFFSEPSLSQSQVVSLILAGGGLESAQGSDPGKAGRDALLAQGSAILAQQLGQRIGIEDVGIEQNLSNETSLVFGKYLSSRLYISYGISLAETINTLKMRYSINDRWTLRTETNKETSAEIVYTVEKN